MKRVILCCLSCLVWIFAHAASERVFVLTDRSAYLSGDRIWCSLFCIDDGGSLSGRSAIAYLELVSADGCAAQAKIGLMDGRGAGEFAIPANTPTGNYRLMAYTSLGGAEDSAAGSRLVSVYNTGALSRVKDGVRPGIKPVCSPQADTLGGITIQIREKVQRGSDFSISVGGADADMCVSVFLEDGLSQMPNGTLGDFLKEFPISSAPGGELEYDGETVRGSVLNADGEGTAILSSSGSVDGLYVCTFGEDSSLLFHTGNIYGDRELVCEVVNAGDDVRIHLEEPFLHPSAGEIPALCLHESQYEALAGRIRSQGATLLADTLVRFLPHREDQLLHAEDMTRIHLDDYTRFPTIDEIVVEILPTARIRNRYGKKELELAIEDGTGARSDYMDQILVMMDGVVIPDFELLRSLDAMLLEDIYICRERIVVGPTYFNGAVNFVSKKNYVTALDFPSNVCVVDFKGVRYPVAYPGTVPAGGEDCRRLLYWHPSLIVREGENEGLRLKAPGYPGRFCIVAEGLSSEGKAVRSVAHFDVE